MTNKLPPLPEPTMQVNMAEYVMGLQVHSPQQMQAYGQQCRDAALEEAVDACEKTEVHDVGHAGTAFRTQTMCIEAIGRLG